MKSNITDLELAAAHRDAVARRNGPALLLAHSIAVAEMWQLERDTELTREALRSVPTEEDRERLHTRMRLVERRRRELEREAAKPTLVESPGPAQFYRVVTVDKVTRAKRGRSK